MAFIQCNFFSKTLRMNTNITVIIPSYDLFGWSISPGMKFKTVYLFHGSSGDCYDWVVKTRIEQYAQARKLAIVMPSVENSYYQNMHRGEKYLSFLTEELIDFTRTVFPLSDQREDTYTAGLSMGGYGALKVALSKPEQYAKAASLSGSVDLAFLLKDYDGNEVDPFRLFDIFADPARVEGTDADIIHLIEKLGEERRPLPELFLSCGTEDFLYPCHLSAKEKLRNINVSAHIEEHPGAHTWDYWDVHIQHALDWIVG